MAAVQDGEGVEVLKLVLPDAFRRTFGEVADSERRESLTRSVVRDCWVRCLRDAFAAFYAARLGPKRIAVFGGRPRPGESKGNGVSTGIPKWSRWEFLHDVAVVEWELTAAAYAKDRGNPLEPRSIPIVTRALWQVESEMAGNGTQVAEDASKLRVCTAANKLLIASFTGQRDQRPWLEFLARTMSGTDGNHFIALAPRYGDERGYAQWKTRLARLDLYRCGSESHELVRVLCIDEQMS